ncbi:MAG: glycosyltransferase family 2 protein [Myxococcota bacterium]
MNDPLLIFAWFVVAVASLPLIMTLFNLATWRRGRPDGCMPGSVSVLIPARNEALNIDACLAAVQASRHPILEIIVYDDDSTDDTAARVEARASRDSRVRLMRGADLPRGWAGKSHACHSLAQAAQGDVLLFLDADVQLSPDGVARLASEYQDLRADLVSAIPRQQMHTWAEQLVLPLLHLTYTSWLPLILIHSHRNPRFMAANGQVLSIKKDVYWSTGGFEAVKDNVVEDMAFCRWVKASGYRVAFCDGFHVASCRMYSSSREVWEGFSKNLYRGIGAKPHALLGVFGLYVSCFILPYILLIIASPEATGKVDALWAAASIAVAANLLTRILLAARFRQPLLGVVVHPLSIAALLIIGLNSYRWHVRGMIRWRGRVYGQPPPLPSKSPQPQGEIL